MTKPGEALEKLPRRRRSTAWTREKITQLIALYRQHDCLWNHYTEAYKNKERRSKAIDDICSNLRITKTDFGKKIHNLRNQFNSEMKKVERRLEENGGGLKSNSDGCKWKHFESLRFLRDVIEPRPGGYQPKMRKMESSLKSDYTSEEDVDHRRTKSTPDGNGNSAVEDINDYQFEESTVVDNEETLHLSPEQLLLDQIPRANSSKIRDDVSTSAKKSTCNPKTSTCSTSSASSTQTESKLFPCPPIDKANVSKIHQLHKLKPQQDHCGTDKIEDFQHFANGSIIELQANGIVCSVASTNANNISKTDQCSTFIPQDTSMHQRNVENTEMSKVRDQWDAFGELIASEFRLLNSDTSRKKLKRKIMHAMLEVGDEDDVVLR